MTKINFYVVLLFSACFLAGCAGRPGPEVLQAMPVSAPGAKTVTIYVATTRDGNPASGVFTSNRAAQMSYARFTISIPPAHKPGNIEWPNGKSNAATDFVTIERHLLDRSSFEREISRKRNGAPPDIGVFVHGYNTNFQEALFRMAQMTVDSGAAGVPILFAWPSEGRVSGYVADKDAVTYSRDQLVDLLTMLATKPSTGEITIIGHSMGAWLTTEALRQLRLTGKNKVVDRLHVILAAPDIDVDVFRAQLKVIGPLSPPLTILVSRDDVALSVSELLSTERQRVGKLDVNDPRVASAAREAKVRIIDISELQTSDRFKHNRFVALAALHPRIEATDGRGPGGEVRQAGAFVLRALGATISSPFVIAGKVVGGE